MKYILIAYIGFNGWFSTDWQILEPRTFPNYETCSRYMNDIVEDLKFHKHHGQNGVKTWHMTCRNFWETDADYQEFLKSIRGEVNKALDAQPEPECILFGDQCL